MADELPGEDETEFSEKSRTTAGTLGVILGPLGVHRFYLGYRWIGILQAIVTVVTGIGAVWGIYEGITILLGSKWRDSEGKLLKKTSR